MKVSKQTAHRRETCRQIIKRVIGRNHAGFHELEHFLSIFKRIPLNLKIIWVRLNPSDKVSYDELLL